MFPHQLNPGVLSNKKDLTGKGCCGLARRKAQGSEVMKIYNQRNKQSKNPKEEERMTICSKFGCASNSALLMELRKKIMTFRDIIDLPPCDGSTSTNVLVMGTVRDLQKLYPEIIRSNRLLEEKGASVDQALTHFLGALKSIGDSWMIHHGWMDKFNYDSSVKQNHHPEELGEIMLEALHCMNKTAKEKFDLMDDDHETKDRSAGANAFDKISVDSYSDSESSYCASPASPATPTSVLPGSASRKGEEKATIFANPPILWSLRIRAVGKLNQVDVKRLSLNALSSLGGHGSSTLSVNNRTEEPITRIEEKSSFGSAATSNKTGDGGNGDDITATSPEMEMLTSQSLPPPVQAPIPPLPPLMLQSNMIEPTTVTTPSPPNPPSNAATNRLHPPPPPPPPLPSFASQTAKAAPSPLLPMMPSVGVAPPPPPPPMVPSKGVAPPPPPPPMIALNGSIASPLPMAPSNGAALPPPPPPFGTKCLRPKKSTTKLKRSSQMGNLYRLLRGKVEGSNLQGKSSNGRKSAIGASAGGKQGMADALAEMTKRSAYFQQIEEDVQKHAKSITELKSAINTFQTKDMAELIKFHKSVESILEYLTDESQVLARFEGFPVKKLEALRTAAALYSKLDAIVTELRCWKITAPLNQQFDKVERYFTKIKAQVDALERTKDEESKKFQSHNIGFDFHILIRIKEAMVDVSSSCMESALKERREAKAVENEEATPKRDKRTNGSAKLLWRAFQFAFRVYTFAGGHDDRADKLTRELAYEIENDPHNE